MLYELEAVRCQKDKELQVTEMKMVIWTLAGAQIKRSTVRNDKIPKKRLWEKGNLNEMTNTRLP